jgi:hypothetical protein
MSKSKKTAAKKKPTKKKVALKKKHPKPPPSHFEFWFSYGFESGTGPEPRSSKSAIRQYYRDYLAQWDADNNESHQIRFTEETPPSHPRVMTLIADIYPGPQPVPHPPPEGGSITPPTPPPPPPPSLS